MKIRNQYKEYLNDILRNKKYIYIYKKKKMMISEMNTNKII